MTSAGTARLFVAVDPPPAVCAELAAWARRALAATSGGDARMRPVAKGVRLLDAESMHVTLCFLGARPVQEIETIVTALHDVQAPGGELSIGAPLWLPPRRPRTLALEVRDRGGELAGVHEAVAVALAGAIDWQPERRRLRAHVTVARLGRERSRRRQTGGGDGAGGDEEVLPATPQLAFKATEVVLYRSWLSPGGAIYEALTTSALCAPSASSPDDPEGLEDEPAGT